MSSVVPFVLDQGVVVADTDTSLLDRPALLAALHLAAQNQLCVLHAPTGAGKSTLIAQYLPRARQQQPVAWLRLAQSERNPVRFFRQLSLAIRQNVAEFAGFTSLQHHGGNSAQQAELASQILLEALASLQQPLQIIIDNLELLVDCAWLPVLQHVIEQSPQPVRWLLSGRNTQGIDPSRWQLRDSFQVFTPQQLFFDEDETRRLLQSGIPDKQNAPVDEALVQRLFQHTKGWPAALKLAQVYLPHHDAQQPIPDALFDRNVFGALLNAMLDALAPELRHFLVNMAFLERFSIPLCDYIFNSLQSEQFIDQIKALGLFVEMDSHPGEYTLHTLFRDHLLERFSRQPAEERERLVTRACLWLVDKGERQTACQLAYRHLQQAFFLELLRQSFREWFRAGEAGPVFYWARELGEDTLADCPEIRFAWSWALVMFGEFMSAEDAIQRTLLKQFPDDSEWGTLFQSQDLPQSNAMGIMFAVIRLFKGEMDATLMGRLQRLYNTPSLPNTLRATIDNIFARYAIMQCHFGEARQRATQALNIMDQTGNHLGYSLAAYLIANACYQNNDIKTASQLCQQQLDNANVPSGATARALLEGFNAFLNYQSDQPALAEQQIHEVLLHYQPGYSVDLQLFLCLPLLHMKTRRGEFEGAALLLQQLDCSASANGSAQTQAHVLYERVRLAYARRDHDEVARLDAQHAIVLDAQALLHNDSRIAWEPLERHIMAAVLVLLDQGKLEQAQQWTQQLQYLNVDHGYPIRFLPLNVCLAYLEFRLGRVSTAFRRLNDSLSQAEATGMLTGLLDDIPDLDDFVCTAIQQQRIQNPVHLARLLELGILDFQDDPFF